MAPEIPSLSHILLAAVVLYTAYYTYWQLTVGANRRRMIRENGCKPIKKNSEYNGWIEDLIGIKGFRESRKAFTQHTLMQTGLERFQRHGNNVKICVLGSTLYTTVEPEILKTVMATKFKDWNLPDRRKSAFVPVLGNGIFTTDGAAWHNSRELLRPNFSRSQVGDLATFEAHVSQMVKAIPRDGSTVDLQDLFFRLTMDSATEFLFGESTNSLAPSNSSNTRFAEAFNRSQEAIGEASRAGWLGTFFRESSFHDDVKYLHNFVDHFVQRGLNYRKTLDLEKTEAKSEERYVFLHELVKHTNDPIQIRSELLNILLAGRDTTASLLSNTWFVLARRPDIWERLQSEVGKLGGEVPTFAQIKEMKYLRQVLNECLRLYPVVPGNTRMAIVDTVLPLGGGEDGKSPLFVPAKTNLGWSVFAMHRRKDLYGEDADEFKPERWDTLRPGWEYLPFNGGPRICLGQQFALTEASYTTIRLMQEFSKIERRDDGQPWTEFLTLTCVGLHGVKVGLTPV
ncbi:MAG: hypothetical protein Q9195_007997 [Heterodermia aff. obscurata]